MSKMSAEAATRALSEKWDPIAADQLLKTYEDFGGLKEFTNPKITREMKDLRDALLAAKNFPSELFKLVLDNTKKITRDEADGFSFCSSLSLFSNFSLFKRFWDINPNGMMVGLNLFEIETRVSSPEWNSGILQENVPMVHAEDCNGNPSHLGCKIKRFRPDALLDITATVRSRLINTIDPRVIDLVQEQALRLSARGRTLYAESLFVDEDHWRLLAADPVREVLNRLTANPLLPTEIAKQIIATHKTALLRENIARYTVDRDLLNEIWNSTKSESIHEAVSMNPFWSNPF